MTRLLHELAVGSLQQLDTDLYGTTGFLELTNDALDPVVVTNHHGDPVTQFRLGGVKTWHTKYLRPHLSLFF